MTRISVPVRAVLAFLCILLNYAAPVRAASGIETLDVNLAPLIEEASRFPDRFAVDVPHSIATSMKGEWTTSGATRTWTYGVRVPAAVSMSFRASRFVLPPSAVLTVTGTAVSSTYRARDAVRGGLWSRPLLGDTLNFSLTVSAAEAGAVGLEISSLQAGYRGLIKGVQDHALFKRQSVDATAAAASCSLNYACEATPANQGPSRSTVAVFIGNTGMCTGTLLNNTREDGTTYILTARHCENGQLGGGVPDSAAIVTVYWHVVSACGGLLGSIFDGGAITQGGATTVVEQQDAWLMRFDSPPEYPDAYFAGWDATGAVFTGGYSIHHALAGKQQYVSWFGQAVLEHIPGSVFDVNYASDFWGVVNERGNIGAGASGGALFDPSNRVVGNLSLAYLTDGRGSAGYCPAPSPPAPRAGHSYCAVHRAVSSVGVNQRHDEHHRFAHTALRSRS